MVGLDDLVSAHVASQVAECTTCRWVGNDFTHDAPRILAKMEHEERTGHKVIWTKG